MYKYILQSIEGINWLAILPLILFFTFFLITTIRVLRQKKSFTEHMAQLPLEDNINQERSTL